MDKFILLSEKNKFKILEYLPNQNSLNKTANYFSNFADSTRLKIISCLAMCDMCVNDLSKILKINQTTISHQLKLLKSQNLVSCVRGGKIIVYSLCEKRVNDIMFFAASLS